MSLLVMNRPESLGIKGLDDIFEDVDLLEGPDATRVVLGELTGSKLARIKRVSDLILGKEVDHHDYFVDLALPHSRFQEVTTVFSSAWRVTPQAAAKEEVEAEYKARELFAVYHPATQPELSSPEEIFNWYDENANKKTLGAIPDISPNIYTVQGMEELIRYGNFQGVEPDA
jgi:hypothetical protein